LHRPARYPAAPTSFIDPALPGTVDFEFSFAFQPIVDASARKVISFEALVRGPHGEPASEVFARVPRDDLYCFDQACRLKAIRLAARLNLHASLNLNFFPNSVQRSSEYLGATLEASRQAGFPVERLVFEVTETEYLQYRGSVEGLFDKYAAYGFQTAIDDFGTGFSGLRRLAEYRPSYIKLDRGLVSDIHEHRVKQVIVRGIRSICRQLSITPVAEGVETVEEYRWLRVAGIHIFQGYYFAQPAFEALAEVKPAVF
jgi:EAL domain-containing protein (putative c-di-GMP-specific phosphodiesterase class I)